MSMKKAVGYTRVSTMEQATSGTSLTDQEQKIKGFCKEQGYKLVKVFSDPGVSGAKMENRPEIQSLMKGAKGNEFDVVVFTNIDRVGRSVLDILNYLKLVKEDLGLSFRAIEQPEISSNTMTSKIMITLLSLFAELEREKIIERMRKGRHFRFKQGKVSSNILPLGFIWNKEKQQIEVDKKQKKIFKKIVDLYLNRHFTYKEIAAHLSSKKVQTPSQLKGRTKKVSDRWNNTQISKLLKDDAYWTGRYYVNKYVRKKQKTKADEYTYTSKELKDRSEWIKIDLPDKFISEAKWNQIQARIASNKIKIKRKHNDYADNFLLENVLRCGECGSRMIKKLKKRENGKIEFRYACFYKVCSKKDLAVAGRERCILRSVDAVKTDKTILTQIAWIISNPAKYAKEWLSDKNTEDLKEEKQRLQNVVKDQKRNVENLGYLLIQARDTDIRDKFGKKFREAESDLIKYKQDLDTIHVKLEASDSYEKLLKELKKPENWYKSRIALINFLRNLPFTEQQRIVEAIIAPESNGRVVLRYARPTDVITEDEIIKDNLDPFEILTDHEPIPDLDFILDLSRVKSLIGGIDKTKLNKFYSSGATRRPYGLD